MLFKLYALNISCALNELLILSRLILFLTGLCVVICCNNPEDDLVIEKAFNNVTPKGIFFVGE